MAGKKKAAKKSSTKKRATKKRATKTAAADAAADTETTGNAPTEPPPPSDEDSKASSDPETSSSQAEGSTGEDADAATVEGAELPSPDGSPASTDSPEPPADLPPDAVVDSKVELTDEEEHARAKLDRARRRRIAKRDPDIPSECPITGRAIDVGPRAPLWSRPTKRGDLWVSALGGMLVDAGVTDAELRHALEVLEGEG